VARKFHAENARLTPRRELPTGHFALAEVACAGRYARALAGQGNPSAGLREMRRLETYMGQLGITPTTHAIHWHYFYHDLGLVYEFAGNHERAFELISKVPRLGRGAKDYLRIQSRLAATKQGS
jgi:hypothetical protein